MTIISNTLRPGLLVSLKTSISGNVRYFKETIEAEHVVESGEQKARWETTRVVADAEEHERAKTTRNKAANLVRRICAGSAFGLLCPEADKDKLEEAVKAARALADEFNATAALSRITVYVITGRIAPDDVEAVKAINSEVKDLMDAMATGVSRMDVKAIRDAASRAKEVGQMLPEDMQARIQIAVETARKAASAIVKAGETAAIEVDKIAIRKITDMRTAFLDLNSGADVSAPTEVAPAVDFAPTEAMKPVAAPATQLEI